MSKWICVMRQDGDGCDYSIGCGVKVVEVEANGKTAAIQAAINKCYMKDYVTGENDPGYYLPRGEGALKSWTLFEITEATDLMYLLDDANASYKKKEAEAEKAEKLAQFEKLRKELGK